ncbi:acyl carrier protein [Streptomyces sp. NPDC005900]|uniref:acyl carrier protein n=1 Tax=Streptomyces sp. NPDC005900 TaxID=3154569 RepID=UPI003407CD46
MDAPAHESTTKILTAMLVRDFEADHATLTPRTPMSEVLIDSLMVVDLAVRVHEQFGVRLGDRELRRMALGELVELLDAQRSRS